MNAPKPDPRPLASAGYIAPISWSDENWNDVLLESCRALQRLGLQSIRGSVSEEEESPCLVFSMGWRLEEVLRHRARRVVPLIFDAFPTNWKHIASVIDRSEIDTIVVTSRPAQRGVQLLLPDCSVFYCAEAIDLEPWQNVRPIGSRSLAVCEFGRRDVVWHDAAVLALRDSGVEHVYGRGPDIAAAASLRRESFIHSLRSAAVSVCIPRAWTDPLETGGLETMTCRYLESIAAGAIVLGVAPSQLVTLFGYNPVVEVEWRDPGRQVLDLMSRVEHYNDLVERNLARLTEVGGWNARVPELLSALASRA